MQLPSSSLCHRGWSVPAIQEGGIGDTWTTNTRTCATTQKTPETRISDSGRADVLMRRVSSQLPSTYSRHRPRSPSSFLQQSSVGAAQPRGELQAPGRAGAMPGRLRVTSTLRPVGVARRRPVLISPGLRAPAGPGSTSPGRLGACGTGPGATRGLTYPLLQNAASALDTIPLDG